MSAADGVTEPQSGKREKRPYKRKVRADLTEDIIWQMRIIPHAHTKPEIENNAEDKLDGGDDYSAHETAKQKSPYSAAEKAYKHHAKTACKKH